MGLIPNDWKLLPRTETSQKYLLIFSATTIKSYESKRLPKTL